MADETDALDVGGGKVEGGSGTPGLLKLYAPEPNIPDVVLLHADRIVLGREPQGGGVALPSGSVSREHACLSRRDGSWVVDDLQSRNGTFVNGVRVQQEVLADGDELRIGALVFQVVERDAERFRRTPTLDAAVAGLRGGARMDDTRNEILRVARADLSVLVIGESGTGKEVVARALHKASGRPGPLAAINCAAVPASLLEAELFGAKRGAFTGIERDRIGLVRSAEGGTLFLDEIGDLPLEAQAKLLRVLDTREVTPLGSHVPHRVDLRVVSATHRSIPQLVAEERFRADLYARISGHTIVLPPLRERKEDIALLVEAFLEQQPTPLRATPAFMIGLLRYDWPLNVRELEGALKRAVAFAEGGVLDEAQLPPAARAALAEQPRSRDEAAPAVASAPSRTHAPPAEELRAVLKRCGGNVAAAARELGKDRAQVHRWIRHHGISLEEFRF